MKESHGNSRLLSALAAACLAFSVPVPSLAYQPGTLRSGMRSEEVREMQSALIRLGYLGGTADGIFGTNTENAVKKFQRASRLKADGLAGAKTLELLYGKAGNAGNASSQGQQSSGASSSSSSSSAPASSSASSASSGLFGGNYATLRKGSSGARVTVLQKQLISLGYLRGSADGKYGAQTQAAVVAFQKSNQLTADGLAGKQTLKALETGGKSASSSSGSGSSSGSSGSSSGSSGSSSASSGSSSSSSGDPSSGKTASAPSGGQVRLLHWYNDIKPGLRSGQTLQIVDPGSGLSWDLRIYSCGRHCDAEPRTAGDTASMLKAFGGVNTWSQKAVYVKLPNGTWTIGATHDMPHMSGAVKDNQFDGHLCVHFLRTMEEAQKNDPSYGVANQKTIRSFWKSLTGEEIKD